MKLLIVAKLLESTDGIRNSGYVAFSLSVLAYFFMLGNPLLFIFH